VVMAPTIPVNTMSEVRVPVLEGAGHLVLRLRVAGTAPYDHVHLQLPAGTKAADVYGKRPFIAATFTFFSLYTLALGLTPSKELPPIAFLLAGLREIGEPARKALIVDLAEGLVRGRRQ